MLYIKDIENASGRRVYQFTGLTDYRMNTFKFSNGATFSYSKEFVSRYFIRLKERR